MADNDDTSQTPEQIAAQTAAYKDQTAAVTDLGNTHSIFGNVIGGVKKQFDNLMVGFSNYAGAMKENQQISESAASAFGILTNSLLGTSTAFDHLNNVDLRGLNTVSDQIKNISNVLNQSLIADQIKEKTRGMTEGSREYNETVAAIRETVGRTIGIFQEEALAIAGSAEQFNKLTTAEIQLLAQSGNLAEFWNKAGNDLSNLNNVVQQQNMLITDSAATLHISKDAMAGYYSILATVPNALRDMSQGTDGSIQSTNMLVATVELARSTGMKYNDIIDSIKNAYDNYNISGNEALQFTARISELSQKYNIELDDMKRGILSNAEAFKMFGNEGEGAARIMNEYLGAFEKTGLSGKASLELVEGLTGGIRNLTIAQKAYVSSQTGGPGGLMGGFKIEQELREGKVDEVFDQVKQTLNKQFGGKIVSLQEASQSEGAAEQFQRQVMMLRNGPLGSFAKDDQSAYRILEGFKNIDEGKVTPKELSSTVLSDNLKKGEELGAQTNTILQDILGVAQRLQTTAEYTNNILLQKGVTQGIGSQVLDQDNQFRMRENLGLREITNRNRAEDILKTSPRENLSGMNVQQSLGDIVEISKNLKNTLMAPLEIIQESFKKGDVNKAQEEYKKQLNSFDRQALEAQSSFGSDKNSRLQELEKEKNNFDKMFSFYKENGGKDIKNYSQLPDIDFTKISMPTINLQKLDKNAMSGDHVKQATIALQAHQEERNRTLPALTEQVSHIQNTTKEQPIHLMIEVDDKRVKVTGTSPQGKATYAAHDLMP